MSRLSKPSAPAGANLRSSRRRTSAALLAFAASAVGLSGSALAQTAAPFHESIHRHPWGCG